MTDEPLLALPSSDKIGETLVDDPLLACEKMSLASSFLAFMVLPLDADVSSFSAFPSALMVLPELLSKERLSAWTSILMVLPDDDFTSRLVLESCPTDLISEPLLAVRASIDFKDTATRGDVVLL